MQLIVVTPKNYSVDTPEISIRSIQTDETNSIEDFAGGYAAVNHLTLTSGITNTLLCNKAVNRSCRSRWFEIDNLSRQHRLPLSFACDV